MNRHPFRPTRRWFAETLVLLLAAWILPVRAADTAPPDLMLAGVYRPGVDLDAYWVSEKLDGVRAYWDGRRLLSRNGNRLRAPQWFTAGFPTFPLDGELWMGRGRFEQLSGTVRRRTPDATAWRKVRFMVFDLPAEPGPFGRRLAVLRQLLAEPKSPYLRLVKQFRVADHNRLMTHLDTVVREGGEGLMLHRDDAPYRAGRTGDLLKLKPYLDAEARVVAHIPGKGKYTGLLGSLLVETEDGRRFRIGTGFTDAQRRTPPPIGSSVTYRYRGTTRNGMPRHASFLRIRTAF